MFMTEGGGAPETYEEYARATQDDRIFAAAAIAWMIEGDTDRAVENCTQIQGSEYDLLKVFIYYDAGKYREALELLEALQDAGNVGGVEGNFLQADILMALEKYRNAEDVYERIIRDAPGIELDSLPQHCLDKNYEKRGNRGGVGIYPQGIRTISGKKKRLK